jgi:predicted ABC-type sugar transport system permease subunit
VLDTLLFYRTPIGTVIFLVVAIAIFVSVQIGWYYALPLAFVCGLVATVFWGILLGLLERPRYRL